MTPRPRESGVTLVEMLVALVLFALVGIASFTVLDTIIRARERTEGRLEAIASLDRALTVFSRDLSQSPALDRSLAEGVLAVSLGQDDGARVDYALRDGRLERSIAGETGEAGVGDPLVQPLFGGVEALRFRILDASGLWQEAWPPEGPAGPAGGAVAVELQLTLAGTGGAPQGRLRRIVELPREPDE